MANPFLPKVAFTQAPSMVGGACWWYRTHLPKMYYGGSAVDLGRADIIHVARMGAVSHFDTLGKLKSQGRKIIYEIDDDFWSIQFDLCKDSISGYVEVVNKTSALCDAMIVTTQSLADQAARMTNKPVYIAPNYLCTKSWDSQIKSPDLGKKPILLASGSNGHLEDFRILADIARLPKMKHFQWVIWGSEYFKNLLPESIWMPRVSLRDYFGTLKALGKSPNILGIQHLLDTQFNRSISKLKWMEYTYAGIPGIYSNLAEYPGYANCTVPGNASAKQWADQIVDAYERREEILAKDKQRLEEVGYMDTGIKHWEDIFLQVMHG
jgi:hypothetical protein